MITDSRDDEPIICIGEKSGLSRRRCGFGVVMKGYDGCTGMDGVLVNDTKREALVRTFFCPYIYLQGGSLVCYLRHRQMNSHCARRLAVPLRHGNDWLALEAGDRGLRIYNWFYVF